MSDRVAALFGLDPDSPLFRQALTHPTYANESRAAGHNQRLEFLGDAVLQLCSSELLFAAFPEASEGQLSRRRASIVNTDSLAAFARQHGVEEALLLGKGAEAGGLRNSSNVLADTVEALLAATYLERGLPAARERVELLLQQVDATTERDAKTALQELAQARGHNPPAYVLTDSGGPDHERWFQVSVSVGGEAVGEGRDRSKRLAEMAAAHQALQRLDSEGGER